MIAKQIAMESVEKSNFARLVNYLTSTQEKHERVGKVVVTNCHSERVDASILEVINTQMQNTRTESDKTYHLLVSFRDGEQPDENTLNAIEAKICAGLGFSEHQRISAVHHDTDNLHIHIAINKIHPTRYTIHTPYNDYKTLGELCHTLEQMYGLERDNHQAQNLGTQNRAKDMEHHAGIESFIGWIKRECLSDIKGAESWDMLHKTMSLHGLEMRTRGNGLVIAEKSGIVVKASSVDRGLSKSKLEQRLGVFQPSTYLDTFNAATWYQENLARSSVYTSKEPDQEQDRGGRNLLERITQAYLNEIKAVQSWDELHKTLRKKGFELRFIDNDLVVTEKASAVIKANSIAHELFKDQLEERLGAFQPPREDKSIEPIKQYELRPVRFRVNTVELYANYKAEQESNSIFRSGELANIRKQKKQRIESAKRNSRLKRAAIKLTANSALTKKTLYALTHKALVSDIEKINLQYQQNRQQIYEKYKRLAWADWLKVKAIQGDDKALLALRGRQVANGLKGNTIAALGGERISQNMLR